MWFDEHKLATMTHNAEHHCRLTTKSKQDDESTDNVSLYNI